MSSSHPPAGIDQLIAQRRIDVSSHELAQVDSARTETFQTSAHLRVSDSTAHRGSAGTASNGLKKTVVRAFLSHKKSYDQQRKAEIAAIFEANKASLASSLSAQLAQRDRQLEVPILRTAVVPTSKQPSPAQQPPTDLDSLQEGGTSATAGPRALGKNVKLAANVVVGSSAVTAQRPLYALEVPSTLAVPWYKSWEHVPKNVHNPCEVGRRMFYNDELGETVPASDDEDSDEPERRNLTALDGIHRAKVEYALLHTIQDFGMDEKVLRAVAERVKATVMGVRARAELLLAEHEEKEAAKQRQEEDTNRPQTFQEMEEEQYSLWCRRCRTFGCLIHGGAHVRPVIGPITERLARDPEEPSGAAQQPCGTDCYHLLHEEESGAPVGHAQQKQLAPEQQQHQSQQQDQRKRLQLLGKHQGQKAAGSQQQQSQRQQAFQEVGAMSACASAAASKNCARPSRLQQINTVAPSTVTRHGADGEVNSPIKAPKGLPPLLPQPRRQRSAAGVLPVLSTLVGDAAGEGRGRGVISPVTVRSEMPSGKGVSGKGNRQPVQPRATAAAVAAVAAAVAAPVRQLSSNSPLTIDDPVDERSVRPAIEWDEWEEGALQAGLEMWGRQPCKIASLVGSKTCRQVHARLRQLPVPSPAQEDAEEKARRRRKQVAAKKQQPVVAMLRHKRSRQENAMWQQYKPCACNGPCRQDCGCVQDANFCEKFCGCDPALCGNRFAGCQCQCGKSGRVRCSSKVCPCLAAGRECDPDLCKECKPTVHGNYREGWKCLNMRLRLGQKKRVLMGLSEVQGWGAFLKEPAKENEFVGEYCGELIGHDEADRRGKTYDRDDNSYLFNLNLAWVVDARQKGNKLRFANHSTNANCKAEILMVDGDHRVAILTKRDMEAGDEIFYNYNYDKRVAPDWAQQQEEKEAAQRMQRVAKKQPAKGASGKAD